MSSMISLKYHPMSSMMSRKYHQMSSVMSLKYHQMSSIMSRNCHPISLITREKQLQLLLVEDGDEPAGDDVVESLEEGGELLPDGARHLLLAHQPDVVSLVAVCHLKIQII